MKFTDKTIEIVITVKPVGEFVDVQVKSNARDIVRTLAALKAAARNIEATIHHRRNSRRGLVLPQNCVGHYERN